MRNACAQIVVPAQVQTVMVATGLRGPKGDKGDKGDPGTATVFSAVCAEDLKAGAPAYVDRVSGQLRNARADVPTSAFVAGLMTTDQSASFVGTISRDGLTLADWTVPTGASLLVLGQVYFLGLLPGTLSTVAPVAGGQSVTVVGKAVSPTQLAISITEPVLL